MLKIAGSELSWQRNMSWLIVLSIIMAVTPMLVGCSKSPTVVKIGLVGPFTGRNREIGYDVIYSSRMAVRQFNETGDLGLYRLELVALDDFGDPESAIENAKALALDGEVVAVVGHWLANTTRSAEVVYEENKLPLIRTGEQPFGRFDPEKLSEQFRNDYAELTPFDEEAGSFAASGYDAIQLIIAALEYAETIDKPINRQSIGNALNSLSVEGLHGVIYQ